MRTPNRFFARYRTELVLAGATLLLALYAHFGSDLRYANDDQFILYRYIEHIATGQGFSFNIGERVLGSTTPLFTVLAACFAIVFSGVATQTVVAGMNALLLALSAPVFYRVARRFMPDGYALISTVIFALNLARTVPEGMETPLFILTLFLFLEAHLRKRDGWSAVFISLAVLTRPDALLVAVLAFAAWWSRAGAWQALRLSSLAGAVALPWLLFSLSYFGSALPQSLAAKLSSADIYHVPPFQAMKVQLAHFSRVFWGRIFDPANMALQVAINLLPLLALCVLGVRNRFSGGRWLIPAIPLLYFVSFSLANPVMFPWYLSQMEPLLILLAMAGAAALCARLSRPVRALFMALLLLGPLVSYAHLFMRGEGGKTTYRDAAAYVRTHASKGDTIGAPDIGILGYESGLPILDFIGLVSPDSVGFYPIPQSCVTGALYVTPASLVRAYEPSWIVASDEQLGPCLLDDAWFRAQYEQEALFNAIGVWRRSR